MMETHPARTAIVSDIADRISARSRNGGEKGGLVGGANQNADHIRRTAIELLLPAPEPACRRTAIDCNREQPARTNEAGGAVHRAPQRSGMVQDTPAVDDVARRRCKAQDIGLLDGPSLWRVEFGQKVE